MSAQPTHHPPSDSPGDDRDMCVTAQAKPADAPAPIAGGPAGVFVTIHTASTGELRGCIGTISPTEDDPGAGGHQQRHRCGHARPALPARAAGGVGWPGDRCEVLYPPEPIESPDQLDSKQYGVIVEQGYRRGLLLPDIPGIDDVATQVRYPRMKAGIGPKEPVVLFRFRVEKYL